MLTMRAQAVAAGMRNQFLVIAIRALNLHHRTAGTAAVPNRLECMKLIKAQPMAKSRQEISLELGDDRSEADHRFKPLARE
jgi:hypothetical protein